MDLSWIWQTTLIFLVGTFLLRIGGRKSIAQMNTAQTIVLIGLGSLIVQPVSERGLFITFAAGFLLILLMVIVEYIEIKVDVLETLFSGKAVTVIQNGNLNYNNLKKLRLSIDGLETRFRQNGISSLEDVNHATIEVSGQLGYELKDNKKPITREDFMLLMDEISNIKKAIGCNLKTQLKQNQPNNIFEELHNKKFEGNKNEPRH